MAEHPRLARIRNLERKLASREGMPGYANSCTEIQRQIDNLKNAQATDAQVFDL